MKTIHDLRNHLFDALDRLKTGGPEELNRARAVADVARCVTDTAKVEVEYMKATGAMGTGFVPLDEDSRERPARRRALPATTRPYQRPASDKDDEDLPLAELTRKR